MVIIYTPFSSVLLKQEAVSVDFAPGFLIVSAALLDENLNPVEMRSGSVQSRGISVDVPDTSKSLMP